jgi:hypothetical protein
MNHLEQGVKEVAEHTNPRTTPSSNIGTMTTPHGTTTPAPTGSSLPYHSYTTLPSQNATTPSAYPNTLTPLPVNDTSSTYHGQSSQDIVVNQFTDLYGQNPSALYRKVQNTKNYDKTIRKGIPSPSGPFFNGMNGQYGNAPGALGGPKMDPYSYFGNVPAKGWEKEPAPSAFDFSKFQ